MKYNKLVRDKVPDIIRNNGGNAKIHLADDKEFSEKIIKKLKEEVNEFLVSKDPKELVDLLEVVYEIGKSHGIDEKTLNANRKKKAKDHGQFSKRIILEES